MAAVGADNRVWSLIGCIAERVHTFQWGMASTEPSGSAIGLIACAEARHDMERIQTRGLAFETDWRSHLSETETADLA